MTIEITIDDKDAARIIDGMASMGNYQSRVTDDLGIEKTVTKEGFLQEYIVKLIKDNVNIAESNVAFNDVKTAIDNEIKAMTITTAIK